MAKFEYEVRFPNNILFKAKGPAAQELFKSTVDDFYTEVLNRGETFALQETPVGASGELIESIETNRKSFFEAEILWTAPYAQAVNKGSRPHFAPIGRLTEWATAKWGNPDGGEILQGLISRQGTKKNGFQLRTKRKVEQFAKQRWPAAITTFIRRLIA